MVPHITLRLTSYQSLQLKRFSPLERKSVRRYTRDTEHLPTSKRPSPPKPLSYLTSNLKIISLEHMHTQSMHTRIKKHISHHTSLTVRVNFARHAMLPIPRDRCVCFVRTLIPYSCALQFKHFDMINRLVLASASSSGSPFRSHITSEHS